MDYQAIQQELVRLQIDGWLFTDFHNRDPIAYRVLGLDFGKFTSRRWFYFIPAEGEPLRLVHRVEPKKLEELPGRQEFYMGWKELEQKLPQVLAGAGRVAMQYSPQGVIPYVSTVDAGTIEQVRRAGVEVVSSADLVQTFEAVLDDEAFRSHVAAGEKIHAIKDEAFAKIGQFVREDKKLTEYDLQQWIMERYEQEGLTCVDEPPIVGINEHPANPHFEPTPENSHVFKPGDNVLIDLWAKLKEPGAVFYDITWCGFVGSAAPDDYREIFAVVRDARQAALDFVRERFASGQPCQGYQVDDACRRLVEQRGYGEYFIHRTGHSIGEEVHGNGVNIDNLETHDERLLVPGICFSLEPGIYLPGRMAARSEIDVFITPAGRVEVSGPQQQELILIEI